MTCHISHHQGGGGLSQVADATAASVSKLSVELRTWLAQRTRLDAQRGADVVLATYEALANCADHAYRGDDRAGTVTLQVTHDTDTLQICVSDSGRWIEPVPPTANSARGRGLVLMRALADDLTVDGRRDGTTVCLFFERCPAVAAVTAAADREPPRDQRAVAARVGADPAVRRR